MDRQDSGSLSSSHHYINRVFKKAGMTFEIFQNRPGKFLQRLFERRFRVVFQDRAPVISALHNSRIKWQGTQEGQFHALCRSLATARAKDWDKTFAVRTKQA